MTLTKEQALKLIPQGCKLNWHNQTKRWYVYTATYHYSPEKKRGIERRTTMGHINEDGVFVYSKHYLMNQKIEQLQQEKQHACRPALPEVIKNVTNQSITDPRKAERCLYHLEDVVLVATLASLSGQTSAVQIADYWKNHREYLSQLIEDFPDSDISHDTVHRLLCLLDPKQIHDFFSDILKRLLPRLKKPVIAVDGQMVRATKCSADGKNGDYLISFYSTDVGLVLGQELVGEKTNEITHAKRMVSKFDLAGAIVTADAMHAQKTFVKELCKARADYCLSLKGNQDNLLKDVTELFEYSTTVTHYGQEKVEKGHGRLETRKVDLLSAEFLPKSVLNAWTGLTGGTLVRCTSTRTTLSTGETSEDVRYFISSLSFESSRIQEHIQRAIRRHWAIENELHYVLDVDFNQDRTQCKNINYLQNRTLLNKLALNFIQTARSKIETGTGKAAPSIKRMMAKFVLPQEALKAIEMGLLKSNSDA